MSFFTVGLFRRRESIRVAWHPEAQVPDETWHCTKLGGPAAVVEACLPTTTLQARRGTEGYFCCCDTCIIYVSRDQYCSSVWILLWQHSSCSSKNGTWESWQSWGNVSIFARLDHHFLCFVYLKVPLQNTRKNSQVSNCFLKVQIFFLVHQNVFLKI